MVESRPLEKVLPHVSLILNITVVPFPIFITLVASSHEAQDVMTPIVMGRAKMLTVMDEIPDWNITMATAILALLSPLVVVVMQRQFVKTKLSVQKQ